MFNWQEVHYYMLTTIIMSTFIIMFTNIIMFTIIREEVYELAEVRQAGFLPLESKEEEPEEEVEHFIDFDCSQSLFLKFSVLKLDESFVLRNTSTWRSSSTSRSTTRPMSTR